MRKYTSPSATYACSSSMSLVIISTISGMCSVARGKCSASWARSADMSSKNAATYGLTYSPIVVPACMAWSSIRSSMSVRFMT